MGRTRHGRSCNEGSEMDATHDACPRAYCRIGVARLGDKPLRCQGSMACKTQRRQWRNKLGCPGTSLATRRTTQAGTSQEKMDRRLLRCFGTAAWLVSSTARLGWQRALVIVIIILNNFCRLPPLVTCHRRRCMVHLFCTPAVVATSRLY